MDTTKSLRAAIVGCGTVHRAHVAGIENSPFGVLAAVCDTDPGRLQAATDAYGVPGYDSLDTLLADTSIQVVHICTPHYLHVPMVMEILRAGKHVITEKPVALDYTQGLELVEAARNAEKSGFLTGVCFQNRYNPTTQAMRRVLNEGAVLKGIKGLVTWHRTAEYYTRSDWRGRFSTEGGGVLINQSIHTLDLMQLFGGPIQSISAHVDTRTLQDIIEVEDTAEAAVFFESGAVGLFYATNCYTTDSSVELELDLADGQQLRLKDGILFRFRGRMAEKLADDTEAPEGVKAYWGSSHGKLIDEFYRLVLDKGGSRVPVEEGIETLRLIRGIYESSKRGEKVTYSEIGS